MYVRNKLLEKNDFFFLIIFSWKISIIIIWKQG